MNCHTCLAFEKAWLFKRRFQIYRTQVGMHNALWAVGGTRRRGARCNNRIKKMMGSAVRPLWSIEGLLEEGISPQRGTDRCDKTLLIWTRFNFRGCRGYVLHFALTVDNLSRDMLLKKTNRGSGFGLS